MEVFTILLDALLARDESEPRSQLQQEGFHFADDGRLQIGFLPGVAKAEGKSRM